MTEQPAWTDVRVALITAPDAVVAERLVHALVEAKLAACGNIVSDVLSIFRWKGSIDVDREVLIVLKTTAASVSSLIDHVTENHPYDVPEVLVLPVVAGHPPYLDWVRSGGGS